MLENLESCINVAESRFHEPLSTRDIEQACAELAAVRELYRTSFALADTLQSLLMSYPVNDQWHELKAALHKLAALSAPATGTRK